MSKILKAVRKGNVAYKKIYIKKEVKMIANRNTRINKTYRLFSKRNF